VVTKYVIKAFLIGVTLSGQLCAILLCC